MFEFVPDWWSFLLLSLASFRVYRLIAEDTILDPIRSWVLRLPRDWEEGKPIPPGYREWLASFLTCPWCAGSWIAFFWWLAWQTWPRGTIITATPWAIFATVALVARNLDRDE